MNAMMNETQLWYRDTCDETIDIKTKLKHINSKTHEHKEFFSTTVKDYEFIAADIDKVKYNSMILLKIVEIKDSIHFDIGKVCI